MTGDLTVFQDSRITAPKDVVSNVLDLDDLHALRARYDPSAFASYVLRDEQTGGPIAMQPIHTEWHRLFTKHKRLLIWAHVEAGKTQQMSIGRVLWELGRNHNLRVAIVSNTDFQAQKICMSIARYIEASPDYHKVFPGVLRSKNDPWTQHQLFIQRLGNPKDPSVRTCGVHGNILGSRIDLLVLDDLLDYENTVSKIRREDLYAWYHSTLEGRMTRDSRILCIGTAWSPHDLMHEFASRRVWVAVRYPVQDEVSGALSWPKQWPKERIAEKKEALGPIEFNRQLLCIARSDEESRFKAEWIEQCKERGKGREPTYALEAVPEGYGTFTGVDLGVRLESKSAVSSLFTIIVHPNEDRELLWIEAGRWSGPEIVAKIEDTHRRYRSIVMVENNAAQEFIVQFTRHKSAVPVKPFTTTHQSVKNPQFGLESLATELANGKWIIPCDAEGRCQIEIERWIGEMLFYDPNGHPGDRLMSSWFAKEASRIKVPKAKLRTLDLLTR